MYIGSSGSGRVVWWEEQGTGKAGYTESSPLLIHKVMSSFCDFQLGNERRNVTNAVSVGVFLNM